MIARVFIVQLLILHSWYAHYPQTINILFPTESPLLFSPWRFLLPKSRAQSQKQILGYLTAAPREISEKVALVWKEKKVFVERIFVFKKIERMGSGQIEKNKGLSE